MTTRSPDGSRKRPEEAAEPLEHGVDETSGAWRRVHPAALVGVALVALIADVLCRQQLVSAGNNPSGAVWALAMLGATLLLGSTTVGWAALALREVRARPDRRGNVARVLLGASLFIAVLLGAYALGPLEEAEVFSSFRGVWLLGVSAVIAVVAGRRWLAGTSPERRTAAFVGMAGGTGALAAGRLWTTVGDAGFSSFPAYTSVWLLVMVGAAAATATATAVSALAALRLVPLPGPRGVAAGRESVESPPRPGPTRWRALVPIAAITVVAGALRFWPLDRGSYWGDEAFTVWVVSKDFGGMLAAVSQTESNPPLYYLLGWGWSKVFGTGEIGLRSLSALFGTATVPVVYAAARTLVSGRAAVVAAGLVALSPVLLGFSGEARNYALFSFLAAASLFFFARALGDSSPRKLWAWAFASILALATHYFGLFLVAPAAVWLVLTTPRRRALAGPLGAIGVTGALLAPLALEQASHRYAGWIGGIALSDRFWQMVHLFSLGPEWIEDPIRILAYTVLALGVWLLVTRTSGRERRGGLLAASLGLSVIAVPLALELVDVNYFFYRNQVAAVPLLAVGLGAGFGAQRAGWVGLAGATALGALSVAVLAWGLVAPPERPPSDWRDAAEVVGAPAEERAVLMLGPPSSPVGPHPLDIYLVNAEPLARFRGPVREITVVEERADVAAPVGAADPFEEVERRVTAAFVVTRLRSRGPAAIPPEALALRRPGRRITHGWLQRRATPGAGENRSPALGRSAL